MEQQDPLENLTEKERQDLLEFMQIMGIEDMTKAKQFMEVGHWDLNAASELYLNTGGNLNSAGGGNQAGQLNDDYHQVQHQDENYHPEPQQQQQQQAQQVPHPAQQIFQNILNHHQQQANQQFQLPQGVTQDQLTKYENFLQQKEQGQPGIFKKTFKGIGNISVKVYNKLMPIAIRGELQGGEEFKEYLKKKIKIKLEQTYDFQDGTLQEVLEECQEQARPLMVFIYNISCPTKELQHQLLKDQSLRLELNKSFKCLGILNISQEADQQIMKHVPSDQWPGFIFLRKDIHDEIKVIDVATISTQQQSADYYLQKAKKARAEFYKVTTQENKIVDAHRRKQQQQRQQFDPFAFNENQYLEQQIQQIQQNDPEYQRQEQQRRQRIEQERMLKEQQKRELEEAERITREQEERRIKEEKEKIEQEKRDQELQKQHENKIEQKKKELRPEPAEDQPDIITVAFRLPQGTKVQRRFLLSDTAQFLFDYIDTLEEIEFEDEKHHVEYDIVQNFPPMSLRSKLESQEKLGDIFDDSNFEQVFIKEL